jgi:hypothetical protein
MAKPSACILGALVAAAVAFPAAAQQHFQGDICGNKADVVLKTPGADANPELKKFWGVWGKGKWDNHMCTGLVVSEINGTTATIQYFYGSGSPPDSPVPGSFIKKDAVMKGKYLSFTSLKGYAVSYELTGGQLKGWFGNVSTSDRLQKLQ